MGRKSGRMPSRQFKSRNNSKPQVYTKQNTNPQQYQQSGPSLMGSMAQGAAIGAGASIGSSMINGVMNMGNSSEPNSNELSKNENKNLVQNQNCDYLLREFSECSKRNYEINECKLFIDSYNECLKYNEYKSL